MRREPFYWITIASGFAVMAFLLMPLFQMMTAPSLDSLLRTIKEHEVVQSIWLSIYTAGSAALISFIFGTPLAYFLARTDFRGKRLIESIIDLPIVIPHPVVGISILSLAGKNHPIGRFLGDIGVRIMGSEIGIITVLTFVGIPFFINAAKNGFESVPRRLENVSRSLGASMAGTFFRITFPLARRSLLIGIIMCAARAISEFGAVVVVAYHPMIAPVLLYERFESFGLAYSQPVAVWLVSVCLVLFIVLRVLTLHEGKKI